MSNPFEQKYTLITGASSGIGYAFTKLFAKEKANLVITARNKDKLESIKNEIINDYDVKVHVLVKDLMLSGSSKDIYNELRQKNIDIDILVNNAGFGYYGDFIDTDLEKQVEMINLNVISLIELTRLFLPSMIKKKFGKILNVASIAGFQPIPGHGIYSATKAFVLNFSESIACELKGTGVAVTCLCPGLTDTNFFKNAGNSYFVSKKSLLMDADTVAKIGLHALRKNKPVVISGCMNKTAMFLERFFPKTFITGLSKIINQKKLRSLKV
jgi:short-subunit dehydrogenase